MVVICAETSYGYVWNFAEGALYRTSITVSIQSNRIADRERPELRARFETENIDIHRRTIAWGFV